jgi:hypothetical protein
MIDRNSLTSQFHSAPKLHDGRGSLLMRNFAGGILLREVRAPEQSDVPHS